MTSTSKALNVVINGAAGQIAYALIPLLCNGQIFGPDVMVNLKLLEIPKAAKKLNGTIMEIKDCAFSNLGNVRLSLSQQEGLRDADVCIFIASHRHKKGMERSDLLRKNALIYKQAAIDLNRYAHKNCKVVVVANPVNSLTTLMARYAPRISYKNFTALSRLDYNRGRNLIAEKCSTNVENVNNLIIWGNHSDTQFADTSHVTINGYGVDQIIDKQWLKEDFVKKVAMRWKEIVSSRGVTSIMSPANAIKDHLKDWFFGCGKNESISMGVISDGNHYEVPKGMWFSMPVKPKGFNYDVVNYKLDSFESEKIKRSVKEIEKEIHSIGLFL